MAKDDLKRLFYRNKTNFSFKKYSTKMRQIFNVLWSYNVPLCGDYKARQLLDNINFPNNDLKTEVNIYRSSHSYIFKTYSTYLS